MFEHERATGEELSLFAPNHTVPQVLQVRTRRFTLIENVLRTIVYTAGKKTSKKKIYYARYLSHRQFVRDVKFYDNGVVSNATVIELQLTDTYLHFVKNANVDRGNSPKTKPMSGRIVFITVGTVRKMSAD